MPILTCTTKAEVEFHGGAADEIAGILFLLTDIRDGRILLADTRSKEQVPKSVVELGDSYKAPIEEAIRILDELANTASQLGATRG